jgi:hypothetical protein
MYVCKIVGNYKLSNQSSLHLVGSSGKEFLSRIYPKNTRFDFLGKQYLTSVHAFMHKLNLSPTFKGSKIDAKKKKFSPFLTLSIVIIIKVLKI